MTIDVALRTYAVNWNPMTRDERESAPSKKRIKATETSSAGGTSVPRANLPGYDALRSQLERENREAASARAAAARSSKPKSAASSHSRAPSDGKGCDHCGGNHYARNCPSVSTTPYSRR